MIKIDVLINEKKWKKYITNPQNYLKNKINKIKGLIPVLKNKKVVFSVLLTGNYQIKNLNKKFRNKNKTTDVLSFPFYHECELRKEDFIYEFNKLRVHGLQHLIGHKHYKNKDFKKMNKLEIKIINKIQNIK